jgi:hypothetical protein
MTASGFAKSVTVSVFVVAAIERVEGKGGQKSED